MYNPYYNSLADKVKPALIKHFRTKPMKQAMAVTLTSNAKNHQLPRTINGRRDKFDLKLRQWHISLCRHFEGQNFHKKNRRHKQQEGIAFPESFHDNPHYHLILDIKEWPKVEYEKEAHRIWRQLCESDSVDVQLRYASKWESKSS